MFVWRASGYLSKERNTCIVMEIKTKTTTTTISRNLTPPPDIQASSSPPPHSRLACTTRLAFSWDSNTRRLKFSLQRQIAIGYWPCINVMSRRLSTRQQTIRRERSTTAVVLDPEPDAELESGSPSIPAEVVSVGIRAYYTQQQREKTYMTVGTTRKRASNAKRGPKTPKWSWPANHPDPNLVRLCSSKISMSSTVTRLT